MKIIKKILIGLGVFIALILIVALFVKKDFSAEREIMIQQPKDMVFDYVRYLKHQEEYSKWFKMDPNIRTTYVGVDGTVGFISHWESDEVGWGEQEIKKITEGERIDYEIRFLKPFKSVSPIYMTTEAIDENQTKVRWGISGKTIYPLNIMNLFMDMEAMIGEDFQIGLNNLKNILENE